MIRVKSLHIYPVKSCRGIDLDRAEVVTTGLRWDRRWMVADPDGSFLSQRSHPVMATVATRIEAEHLILAASGMSDLAIPLEEPDGGDRTVTLWGDRCRAVSEGETAARWFSALLSMPCELVRQPVGGVRPVGPDFGTAGDRVSFADGFPFLLLSQASIDDLNDRLETPVTADRFRANIIVSGCAASAEDGWRRLVIGGIGFRVVKPCARCIIVATDQSSGLRGAEPLRTLATYRSVDGKVLFGQNLIHDSCGTIAVGDEMELDSI